MLVVSNDSKVFIYCPSGAVTGGAELLHQLCDLLNKNNQESYIVYYGKDKSKIPSEYNDYQIKVADKIIDESQNIVVTFEGIFSHAFKIRHAQLFLWWLSVDNFYYCQRESLSLNEYLKWKPKFAINAFLKKMQGFIQGENRFQNNFSINDIRNLKALNGYQSEYAKDFLLRHNIKQIVPLKDYINTEHYQEINISNRDNIVLYNPKKGMEFTQKLINYAPSVKWIPIQNMSRLEVLSLMRSSKLYIDFGFHPGKDRLPREAAINGCCIITGKNGSAGFFDDIPISDSYKFDQRKENIPQIINRISDILANYNILINEFYTYRNAILKEKEEFESHALKIFLQK